MIKYLKVIKLNFFGHIRTITKHRHKVIAHCAKAGIFWQGLRHDMSKYLPAEFIRGVKNYNDGVKSPNEKERQKYGYSAAWLHHKGRNKHHFEYWTDYNTKIGQIAGVKMPVKYVKEMFCDRVAASKIYQGENYTDSHPIEYFLRGKPRRNLIHPETSDLLEEWLTMLSAEGEEKTFAHIRKVKEY